MTAHCTKLIWVQRMNNGNIRNLGLNESYALSVRRATKLPLEQEIYQEVCNAAITVEPENEFFSARLVCPRCGTIYKIFNSNEYDEWIERHIQPEDLL